MVAWGVWKVHLVLESISDSGTEETDEERSREGSLDGGVAKG